MNLDRARTATSTESASTETPSEDTSSWNTEQKLDWKAGTKPLSTGTTKTTSNTSTSKIPTGNSKKWENPYKNNRNKWVSEITSAYKALGLNDALYIEEGAKADLILIDLLKKADEVNEENVKKVSDIIYQCIKGDGVIYMFGCGHSSLIASDCFYRAGGLANIQPIFIPELMLHVSASNSNLLEKDQLSCKYALEGYNFAKNDVLFVFSVSGINGAPIEVARQGKELGLKVVGIGSSTYFDEKSRHSSGVTVSTSG